MTNIEARKLSIIEYLAEVQDEAIITQIENLLKPKVDFWDTLPEADKEIIQKGLNDLDEGRKVPFSEFLSKVRKPER